MPTHTLQNRNSPHACPHSPRTHVLSLPPPIHHPPPPPPSPSANPHTPPHPPAHAFPRHHPPFYSPDVWRCGVVEAVGMLLYTWISGVVIITINRAQYAHPELMIGLIHAVLVALFILALVSPTGAHFSSAVTVTAFATKFVSLP